MALKILLKLAVVSEGCFYVGHLHAFEQASVNIPINIALHKLAFQLGNTVESKIILDHGGHIVNC